MSNYLLHSIVPREIKKLRLSERLNVVRAGVLGANDGIISVAGIVTGVAGAQQSQMTLFISGLAGMFAGALSMGGSEYVSVSTQRDTQRNMVKLQEEMIAANPNREENALASYYESKGLGLDLSRQVSSSLMEQDPLAATLKSKFNIEFKDYFSPWQAAFSSFFSFIIGSLLPLMAITFIPYPYKVSGTMFSVIIALTFTGYISSRLGKSNVIKGILRNLLVGLGTMIVTYLIGTLLT